ncbi:hypothetical protein [Streptomyces olivochromogenes]|uniref:hypothetical protein n=1 Tax=Streptomyces olivochromogenes TaxID=1963 RepID=UPI001F3B53EE|nr:hypothetical protein [Streptomyces olivochromogenes]MCF3132753.1 hypothetical protein [Streptomyces olivochromogenes]
MSAYCAAHAGDCRFKVDRAASSEYHTAVKSLGNAVVNCTKEDIKVTRQLSLQVSSSDDLGGEITGQITIEGQLGVTGSVTAGVSGEAGGNFKTPDQSKGPSAEVNAKGSANGSGTVGGSASLRAAFEGAFKLSYSKTWTTQQTESTSYEVVVKPGDALVFGASAAMQRVAGSISTGSGLGVRNVFVDGPSSAFVADTFTVPGSTCLKLRPGGQTGVEDTTTTTAPKPPTRRAGAAVRPVAVELPAGSRLVKRVEATGERSWPPARRSPVPWGEQP